MHTGQHTLITLSSVSTCRRRIFKASRRPLSSTEYISANAEHDFGSLLVGIATGTKKVEGNMPELWHKSRKPWIHLLLRERSNFPVCRV